MSFTNHLTRYERNFTYPVDVGNCEMGGKNPIRVQSMTTTDTNDIGGSIDQAIRIIKAGGEVVRLTAQGTKEAENLKLIKDGLLERGYSTPLVADIHFNPKAAYIAAQYVDKVRINPGNFVEAPKKFKDVELSAEEEKHQLQKIEDAFIPFLDICKEHNTAIRIGVNHGSLSDRIMSKYGDTPEGMVASCLEYLRIARDYGFTNIVISLKASNTRVMVHAVRLLVKSMKAEELYFPLHLGVTEAGNGEEGRIKSAVGIGALLNDGIGDTIRVSLSEPPENEIIVARQLLAHYAERETAKPTPDFDESTYSPFQFKMRHSDAILEIGGQNLPVVLSDYRNEKMLSGEKSDWAICEAIPPNWEGTPKLIIPSNNKDADKATAKLYQVNDIDSAPNSSSVFIEVFAEELDNKTLEILSSLPQAVILLKSNSTNKYAALRAAVCRLTGTGLLNPVILLAEYEASQKGVFQLKSAADLGGLFLDGLGNGICLKASNIDHSIVTDTGFAILQASRMRFTKTEYISCPSCGRTLFDLQETVKHVKKATDHLIGLKIAVMGCIVNGPGEMADADYGYVGAAPGKISLYKGQNCLKANIAQDDAVDELVNLIKENGDWHEPAN